MAFSMKRIEKMQIVFAVLILLLIARIVYLQVFIGQQLASLGLLSRVHELKLEPVRGRIFDRHMESLTDRDKQFQITIFPSQLKDRFEVVHALTRYTKLDEQELSEKILTAGKPFKLINALTEEKVQALESLQLEGVVVSEETERYSALAAHVIGYANKADNRGISGLEGMYDEILKSGQEAYLAALLDARAEMIPGLNYKKVQLPVGQGINSIVLTLDYSIQKITEEVFDQYAQKGAVVVMEPYTGDILAMVSRPNFNAAQLPLYLDDQNSPLLNRAITAYQPGSVFKLAVAAAALEKQLTSAGEQFIDRGYIDVDGTVFRGWDYKRNVRTINFSEAMAYSSNPVLIEVGLRLGMKDLVAFAKELGFGNVTSLNFYGESAGNLPNKENIYRGETANLSIGQGECEATPLQMASLVATIVNDGIKVNPILVDRVLDEQGNILQGRANTEGKRVFSLKTARTIQQMMVAVNQYGTGQAAFAQPGGSAGKTGSAETGRTNAAGKGINHAWFAGYAPIKSPRYVIVVFVEDGMSGGEIAAPIFRTIAERIEF